MKRINSKLIALIPAVLLLAACHQQSGSNNNAASTSAAAAATASPSVQPQQASVISVVPGSMAACDPAAVAKVSWNASGLAGVNSVQIYVGSAADEKLFAAGGAVGSSSTGPWTRPGTTFTAKDAASGKVLGTVTVQGPACKP
ncbi:MAG: hypothetical protein M0P72_07310 [Metallibacterium scheffleri]|jgi:uncharacterized lipoprotein YajG|uniref:hypothetical protein n=1 Tax=Metallibacterium scheffleri TaxID=993689 RepID=UPI0026EE4C55|nr:hypothetical protein [Metallibacterium scheffleri]MCK9366938.1 hypothetical protein [Metallibacterium scheffleri]